MAPTLNLLGLSVQTRPLVLLLGILGGLWLASREAKRLGLEGERVHDLLFYGLLATAIGARLSYVLRNWSAYQSAPLAALSPTLTALSWPEGAIIGGLVALVLWRRYELPAGPTLDALSPGLSLLLAAERVGAFLAGAGIGAETSLPWGVPLWGTARHPLQLYEAGVLLVVMVLTHRHLGRAASGGTTFALFVALYAGSRVFLEAFRAQTPLLVAGLRSIQVGGLVVMMGSMIYLYYRRFSIPVAADGAAHAARPSLEPESNVGGPRS